MAHPINELMSSTMSKIREMMDANTVVGEPIQVGEITVVPVCKVSLGYGTGGTDFAQKNQKPEHDNSFGGGAGVGVSIVPVSFLVIKEGSVRILSVSQPATTTVDRMIDLVPDMVEKVETMVNKKKTAKNHE